MFNFFRKTKPDLAPLKAALALLPDEFSYLRKQVDDGLVGRLKTRQQPVAGYRQVIGDVAVLNRYEDKKGRYFKISGIEVHNKTTGKPEEWVLHVAYGILLGYYTIPPGPEPRLKVTYFDDQSPVAGLLDEEELSMINVDDVYEVELLGKTYYHLLGLEDGDFIGMDEEKHIYKITHDPLEVVLLDGGLKDVLMHKR